ncbi:DNA N-4 cytosine methyltransferase M.NgoMXV [Streptococcus pyogenes]|nr:DNA N-4 cytosine methyltransferase M.NgoMXV [Streptococcus pyogenes]VGR71385.1 DNA N-4 cytosine methyltransferase M.NgoMXV [Streptococcus pyogenes]VGS28582.1 DNA N-4 cytosine methyltransferase M.NgoMXV [Streptococcus pyogenes]VGS47502.1 DNA N-4 cytosine methyltransferase M.NgoMXV [Streptococcus pyogenes]VGS68907.1 DNA N-4 cytosine methyltransferase M.NgoMXV [Streptococcus pyogenes]
MRMSDIKILDACCGSRLFWFDKNEPHTTFMDVRQEKFGAQVLLPSPDKKYKFAVRICREENLED